MNISSPYDRDILRYFQACLQNCLHRPDGDRVVVTENCLRNRAELQDLQHTFVSRVVSMASGNDITWIEAQPMLFQGAAVTLQPRFSDNYFWPTQVADKGMALRNQVFRSQSADGLIVNADKACCEAANRAIN